MFAGWICTSTQLGNPASLHNWVQDFPVAELTTILHFPRPLPELSPSKMLHCRPAEHTAGAAVDVGAVQTPDMHEYGFGHSYPGHDPVQV
jgi:hypothetical protein